MTEATTRRRWDAEYTDLCQYPNDTYYLYYWSPKLGRSIEVSLKTKVKARAIRERKRRLESLGEEKTKDAVGFKTFQRVIDAFWADSVWDAPATKLVAENQINNHIAKWFGGYDPDRVDNNLWRKYAHERRKADPKCSLFNANKYLSKVLNWAFEKRIVKQKPKFDDFDAGRKSPGVELSDKQYEAILKHLPKDWHDMTALAIGMGLRHMEVKKMRWDWIDRDTRELHIPAEDSKTRVGRSPVIPRHLWAMLIKRPADTDYVFPGGSEGGHASKNDEPWQRAKKKAKVKCRFHDLRHTFLSRAFRASNRYAEICAYAGLSLDEALERYVHFTVKDMKAVAEISDLTRETAGKT